MGPVKVADPIEVSAKLWHPTRAGRPVYWVITELPPIVPVPAISWPDCWTVKVVLPVAMFVPVAGTVAVTVYVPGTSALGPPLVSEYVVQLPPLARVANW